MRDVAIFFRKKICNIDVTGNVLNGNNVVGDRFANGVFPDLNMAKTLGSHVGGPQDTSVVVIIDSGGTRAECVEEVEVGKDKADVKNAFAAFIGSVDFSLGGATGGDGLSLRLPVEWAIEPLDITRHRASLEEGQRGLW